MNCLQPCNGSNSWQCPGSLEVSFFFLITLKLLLINFHQFLCLFLFVCLLCFVLLFIITVFFILKEFDVLVKNSKAPSTLNPVIFESAAFFPLSTRIRLQIDFARAHVSGTYPDSLQNPGLLRQNWRQSMRLKRAKFASYSFSSPEPVVYWSRGLETRGSGSSRYRMSENFRDPVTHVCRRYKYHCSCS